ncbi:MAG: hypothetical protein ACM3ZC_12110 [Bacteroidota bacterium]
MKLNVSWANKTAWRSLSEITSVTAVLSRQSLTVTRALTVNPTTSSASGEIGGLYAGEWTIRIEAAMADATVIYSGQTKVMVVSGGTSPVSMTLNPAPGTLDVTLDVSFLIAAGQTVTEGKVYIYMDPATGSSTTEEMSLEGTNLHALVENLAPRTYDAKVCVPQVTDAIFTSEYFQFDILPGRATTVFLGADGNVAVNVDIVEEPGRVAGFTAVKSQDGTQVFLNWTVVPGATGYRVYRTDDEGRFRQLVVLEGGSISSHTDTSITTAKPYAGMVRYAVAALAGELEGLRSDPASVTL